MPGGEVPGASGPYFFLSYAHTPQANHDDTMDPNVWVVKLFKDLCSEVTMRTTAMLGEAGFMDRRLWPGDEWPIELSQALATCRVFVPLYSPRYFESRECGKEWSAFAQRAQNHTARGKGRTSAIIPALWIPVGPTRQPSAASRIQFTHDDLGAVYAEEGFWGIIKLDRYKDEYNYAVKKLAQRIVDVAQQSPVAPGPVTDYESLESAFGEEGRGMTGGQRLRITVVAPRSGKLPAGRSAASFYGDAAQDWNPYYPDSTRALADHAADLARSHGYRPDVSDLEQRTRELRDGASSWPEVLLIDPWAVTQRDVQRMVKLIDDQGHRWVRAVIVWSSKDDETNGAGQRLRMALDAALPRKLSEEGRATAAMAVRGVPSLDSFSMVLPTVIGAAARHYLRNEALPPDGQVTQ